MKTPSLFLILVSLLAIQARAGSLAVNGNLTAPSLNVGTDITATNQTSIGAAGTVTISTLEGNTSVFGIALIASNAYPE